MVQEAKVGAICFFEGIAQDYQAERVQWPRRQATL
jgi:hypothetical protein